jgi:hypothetical protein
MSENEIKKEMDKLKEETAEIENEEEEEEEEEM